MKKFILKLTFLLVPILLFVVSVNFIGDASNLFSIGYEEKIADQIIKGNNVTNIYNYNERLLNKYLITKFNFCPDVLAIGSSRVMLINSSYFNNKTFFNTGVSGASIEDLMSTYQMYEQKKCLPKRIILGLDPWTLNINNGQMRWSTLNHEYLILYNQLTGNNIVAKEELVNSTYLQLISLSYFKISFKKLISGRRNTPISTTIKTNNTFTKILDGSISYDLKYRSVTAAEIEEKCTIYTSGDIYGVEKFDEHSTEIRFLLEKFIEHLRKNNIEISIFLAPYHPKVYSFISKSDKYRKIIESESYFIDLGLKYEIEVLGSFNPNKLNMDGSYFYDGMHCNEKGIEKILKNEIK
ncbi:MAG: hypothetical protein ACOYPR_05545 [Saprospiraceae bacterium]